MKKNSLKLFVEITIWILLFTFSPLLSQSNSDAVQKIFSKIKLGLETKNVDTFSDYLTENIYINLENNTTDYFSKDQTYSVLHDYILRLNPSEVETLKTENAGDNPFIIYQLKCDTGSSEKELRFFISLKQENGEWKIFQIIIN